MKSYSIRLGVQLFALAIIFLMPHLLQGSENFNGNSSDKDSEIRRGYKPTTYKKDVGYEIIRFGHLGGEFSRIKRVYDYIPCCRPTQNDIDGCSAPEICPKYDVETGQ